SQRSIDIERGLRCVGANADPAGSADQELIVRRAGEFTTGCVRPDKRSVVSGEGGLPGGETRKTSRLVVHPARHAGITTRRLVQPATRHRGGQPKGLVLPATRHHRIESISQVLPATPYHAV